MKKLNETEMKDFKDYFSNNGTIVNAEWYDKYTIAWETETEEGFTDACEYDEYLRDEREAEEEEMEEEWRRDREDLNKWYNSERL